MAPKGIQTLLNKPIIPYVTDWSLPDPEPLAHADVLFVSGGELAELPAVFEKLDAGPTRDIPVMLHIDLINGLMNDDAGLRYVANYNRVVGVITTKHHLVHTIRKLGLYSVIRLFLQDGRAVERGMSVIERSKPDAVELLPGIAATLISAELKQVRVPLIAGGLIRNEETADRILKAGCQAVSTSNKNLWKLNI
jgi:glycerol uptake operon antiterminator